MSGPTTDRASRQSLRTAVVWSVLSGAVDRLAAHHAGARAGVLDIVDAGGGTGGFAVPLAVLGHRVTVVDPSPDSLAALERRSAEAGVAGQVQGIQGDAAGLPELLGADTVDVVLCHSVLEVVDDPAAALAGAVAVLRSGGIASVLAAGRPAAVIGRAISGRFAEAAHVLVDGDGRFGDGDALLRRFTEDELVELLVGVGLQVDEVHGVRVFSDLVPGGLLDDPTAGEALLALEEAVAHRPEFRTLATQLHLLATR